MVLGHLGSHIEKIFNLSIPRITKINSRLIIVLTLKNKAIKLLEDSIGKNSNLGIGKSFIKRKQKPLSIKKVIKN